MCQSFKLSDGIFFIRFFVSVGLKLQQICIRNFVLILKQIKNQKFSFLKWVWHSTCQSFKQAYSVWSISLYRYFLSELNLLNCTKSLFFVHIVNTFPFLFPQFTKFIKNYYITKLILLYRLWRVSKLCII